MISYHFIWPQWEIYYTHLQKQQHILLNIKLAISNSISGHISAIELIILQRIFLSLHSFELQIRQIVSLLSENEAFI